MDCIVYGIGSSYLYDVLDSLDRMGWSVAGYVCNLPDGKTSNADLPAICKPAEIKEEWLLLPIVFPQITPGFRVRMKNEALALGFTEFASVIDPTAIISPRCKRGQGLLVNAGTIVAANAVLGDFCVLNRGVSIGHNTILDEYVTFGPGAISCGSVRIGKGTFVGAGAIINPKVTVGENCIIGSGCVVNKDVAPRSLVVGNPARIAKTDIAGYNDALA